MLEFSRLFVLCEPRPSFSICVYVACYTGFFVVVFFIFLQDCYSPILLQLSGRTFFFLQFHFFCLFAEFRKTHCAAVPSHRTKTFSGGAHFHSGSIQKHLLVSCFNWHLTIICVTLKHWGLELFGHSLTFTHKTLCLFLDNFHITLHYSKKISAPTLFCFFYIIHSYLCNMMLCFWYES